MHAVDPPPACWRSASAAETAAMPKVPPWYRSRKRPKTGTPLEHAAMFRVYVCEYSTLAQCRSMTGLQRLLSVWYMLEALYYTMWGTTECMVTCHRHPGPPAKHEIRFTLARRAHARSNCHRLLPSVRPPRTSLRLGEQADVLEINHLPVKLVVYLSARRLRNLLPIHTPHDLVAWEAGTRDPCQLQQV